MFSIIVPSYNKAKYIEATINSVKNQSYTNWELIIVDDGSTDNSVDIITKASSSESRILFFKRETEKKGGSVCRNIGIEKAKGNYIVFLDADDLLHKNCLKNRIENIGKHKNFNFYVFPIATFYKKIGDSSSVWVPKGKNFLERFLKHDLVWHTMSVVWDINFLKTLNGFDTDYERLQDVELHTRALLSSKLNIITFPKNTLDAYYRIDEKRTEGDTKYKLKRQLNGTLIYLEKVGNLLIKNKHKKLIRKTLFSFITTLNYNCFVLSFNKNLHASLISEVTSFFNKSDLFNRRDICYLKFYVKYYRRGFWKLKGFNYLMKLFF